MYNLKIFNKTGLRFVTCFHNFSFCFNMNVISWDCKLKKKKTLILI